MSDRFHYNSSGRYSSQADVSSFGIIIIGATVYWLWMSIMEWQTLELPYRYVAASYYYSLLLPLKFTWDLFYFFLTYHLTPYHNLNLVMSILIALIAVYVYLRLVGKLVCYVFILCEKVNISFFKLLFCIYILPLLLALFWALVAWLFAV